VLIANKHGSVAKVIERVCGKLGYAQVQTLATAEEVITALDSLRFNLILMDDNLGPQDMAGMIESMKRAPGAADAQIILTTTSLSAATAKRAIAAGVDDILLKPFSPEALMLKLSAAGQPRRQTVSSSDRAWA
jgi:CheY-like chemotaxis protein